MAAARAAWARLEPRLARRGTYEARHGLVRKHETTHMSIDFLCVLYVLNVLSMLGLNTASICGVNIVRFATLNFLFWFLISEADARYSAMPEVQVIVRKTSMERCVAISIFGSVSAACHRCTATCSPSSSSSAGFFLRTFHLIHSAEKWELPNSTAANSGGGGRKTRWTQGSGLADPCPKDCLGRSRKFGDSGWLRLLPHEAGRSHQGRGHEGTSILFQISGLQGAQLQALATRTAKKLQRGDAPFGACEKPGRRTPINFRLNLGISQDLRGRRGLRALAVRCLLPRAHGRTRIPREVFLEDPALMLRHRRHFTSTQAIRAGRFD